ncbi:DsrE/DsrF/DrsH-like family protein [Vallitalea sp.]|jgi:NADPH-dependent 2,4-dienoyl-CoA reductase/sulfur reductase-like enzyme/peroxiredoxin family protein/TusA-related sulfurtransferase/rhodanese-related sulfurtransferase|uniref:DsrE/DsrF/DrsH-like family protein n=1 Tax=Vallitalea sp. TaxID=1882829 RepID=UPI0025E7A8BE|nr:DsrE/DsrF/DrsH-like family protein [Vallitalea sp.]MCT4688971.1 DsrE/DsrF/DrsH-like family protein [Vallitalea sp.]
MINKVLIVGGVAGGASTAARLRRVNEDAQIIMFERGKYISFANCGLPYYIGGTIEQRDALLLQTPEAMKDRFNIDVRVQNEVVSINKDEKYVEVKDLKTGEIYRETYDNLVLSPGSTPIKPPIPGIDKDNIFSIWNIPDTDAIKSFLDSRPVKKVTVIGGGFIGIEMAENMHDRGLEVNLVEMADQVMAPVDYDMAQLIHGHMAQKGIKLFLNNGVSSFEDKDSKTYVKLQDGTMLESDMVILSIGIKPNGELAKNAGLDTNKRGGIIVDEYLKTSDNSIYAVGDAIEVVDYVNGSKTMIPLAGPANKQGRIVANNIVGKQEKYKGTMGTSVVKVFDLTVATTGNNEKTLNRLGKKYQEDYKISLVQPKSHAGYYPGAIPMTIKLMFDLEGKILGVQIIGYEGVDKRIDVIATLIKMGGTIYDLKELELAYAPPYSSAKDPVNMAGFSAENILSGDMEVVLWDEIDNEDKQNSIILDVRDDIELELGYIKGAKNIPVNSLRNRIDELDKNKEILVYCAIGIRGYIASRILTQKGYKAKNLIGGYNFYKCVAKDYTKTTSSDVDCDCFVTNTDEDNKKELKSVDLAMNQGITIKLNACGLQCPGPIMQVNNKMKEINTGDILEISATDPGFPIDVEAWCKKTGNSFIKTEKREKEFVVWIGKGNENVEIKEKSAVATDKSTMVVFSGELDKALASFIIANGAASMGKEVSMFFTFWGLNILRKEQKVKVKKSVIEKMFGFMMPKGTKKLKLSKMNMAGMGSAMMKKVMRDKNVNSLEELIKSALDNGVKIVACTMSMDVMGIKKEELIDGIELGGVASYLGDTDDANHNLFI